MGLWRQVAYGVRSIIRRKQADQDVADEVQHYVDEAAAAYEALGFARDRARRAALAEVGSATAVRDRVRSSGWESLLHTVIADLRYAIRRMKATPGFSLLAIVMLAVGIGGNSAIFTLIDTLYFKALPLAASDRLVHFYAHRPGSHFEAGFSDAEFASVRGRMRTVSALAAETSIAQLHVVSNGAIREARGEFVSGNYFQTLNVAAAEGRVFLPQEDEAAGRNPVAVISDRLNREVFGGTRAIGAVIRINGLPATVIGIAPPKFLGDDVTRGADLWLSRAMLDPMGYGCASGVECNSIDVLLGRLADGEGVESAQAEGRAAIVWSRALDEHHDLPRTLVVEAAAGADPDARAELRPQMQLLGALTAVLLIVACANLAGLLLARALTRRREIAVRLSIGASRLRVVRQLLIEGLLVSAIGGAGGFLVSRWAVALLAGFYNVDSEGFLHSYDFEPDTSVFLYVCAVAVATGIATAIVPALQSSRQDLAASLKDGRGGDASGRGGRLRRVLVAAQIALSFVLIVCSSLLARSGTTVTRGTHFDPAGLVVLRIRPELARFSGERAEAIARTAADALRRTPAVQSVAMMVGGEGLVWHWESGRARTIERPGLAALTAPTQDVDEAFFSTLGIPLVAGRAFTVDDRRGAESVAVVNETLARALWPGGDSVGRSVLVDGARCRIVGVAADIQPPRAAEVAAPHLYRPFWQTSAGAKGDVRFAIRVAGSAEAALPRLRAAIRAADPGVPLGEDMTMSEQMALEYAPVLLARRVTVWCGAIALVFSALGLYSVLTLATRSRTREIGIRIAIGARPAVITRQFLAHALALGSAGIAAGIGAAWMAMRLIESWLYGVNSHDPRSYASAASVLLMAVLAAGYLPARRAARVDPLVALRDA